MNEKSEIIHDYTFAKVLLWLLLVILSSAIQFLPVCIVPFILFSGDGEADFRIAIMYILAVFPIAACAAILSAIIKLVMLRAIIIKVNKHKRFYIASMALLLNSILIAFFMFFIAVGYGSVINIILLSVPFLILDAVIYVFFMERIFVSYIDRGMIIAIDGPLASGKGTLARALAAHFSLPHLDTGSLYRAVAHNMMREGYKFNNTAAAADIARHLNINGIIDADLRTAEVGAGASVVAAMPEVRKALFDFQRKFAANPKGAVLDGRDIGTVICPDADFKFFITARPEIRAERRLKELHAAGDNITLEELTKQIEERDYRDANRADAPLKPTETSIILDTSDMGIDEVIQKAVGIIDGTNK